MHLLASMKKLNLLSVFKESKGIYKDVVESQKTRLVQSIFGRAPVPPQFLPCFVQAVNLFLVYYLLQS